MPQKVIFAFLFLLLIWVMIAGFEREEIVLGVVVSSIIALVSSREFIKGSVAAKFHPRRWVMFFIYMIVFVAAEIYSHLSLAWSIITGITGPKIFNIKSKFREPVPLTVLGNSITLTPGTLTLDIKGRNVVACCIDSKSRSIIKVFETFLEGIFK